MTNLNESELREDIPLKSDSKTSSIHTCNEYLFEGPKFITTAFVFFTIVITVALVIQIYYGDFQVVPHGSVATDSQKCSEIGTWILKQGGNAIDAAIASAVCLAVVNPYNVGLDATCSILIYNHKTRENPVSINFNNHDTQNVRLPKLIINLAQLHQIYGHLPWKELVQPSAELAMNGFFISIQFQQAFKNIRDKKLYKNVEAGKHLVLDALANTLQSISDIPAEDLYNQVNMGGKAMKVNAVRTSFKNYNIFIPDSQNIGEYLFSNLKKIEDSNFTKSDINEADYTYQLAKLTQVTYNESDVLKKFHQGTISNIAAMDLNDIYVSLVIGMYAPFGSQNMTEFGYLLDIESSMPYSLLPLIITDSNYICAERIILGINDVSIASQIITSLAHGVENATTIIEYQRFIILGDNAIGFEEHRSPMFSDDVYHKLEKLGHISEIAEPYTSCNFVEKFADNLNSHSDSRGGGISNRF